MGAFGSDIEDAQFALEMERYVLDMGYGR